MRARRNAMSRGSPLSSTPILYSHPGMWSHSRLQETISAVLAPRRSSVGSTLRPIDEVRLGPIVTVVSVISRRSAIGSDCCSGRPGRRSRLEHDDGCLGRARGGVGVEPLVDVRPALPQPFARCAVDLAGSHRTFRPALEMDDGVGVGLEIEPPCRLTFIPTVHRQHDWCRPVFDVANDDAAFLTGGSTDGCDVHRAPTAFARWGPQDALAEEAIEEAVPPPEEVLEPCGRQLSRARSSGNPRLAPPRSSTFASCRQHGVETGWR